MNDKKRSLLSKLRWWELLLASAVFAYLMGRTLINIPNINDDGVKQVEDVVVSWSCSGLGKSEYQKLIGQSGKSYVMGGSRNTCRQSKGEDYYVGRRLTAFYKQGDLTPIQIDIDGGGGYKAGIKGANIFAGFAVYGFPIFMVLLIVAKKRRGDYAEQ